MNELQRNELAALVDQYSGQEGVNVTPIPGVYCFKATSTEQFTPSVYKPSLCVIAQGSKQVMLGREIYSYKESEYLIVSVDLPIIGQVLEASRTSPYLCMKINLDPQQLSDLMGFAGHGGHASPSTDRGLFIGQLETIEAEAILRLARLMNTPDDIPVLAPLMVREVYYRLLCSPYGNTIAQIALNGSHMQRIASVIQVIKSRLQRTVSVQELAERVGMSVSTFHVHFKSVTGMSPLQFQKNLRLQTARQLLIAGAGDATQTAYQVGYESPSQFNREYARMFGNPPRRDVNRLRERVPRQVNSEDY